MQHSSPREGAEVHVNKKEVLETDWEIQNSSRFQLHGTFENKKLDVFQNPPPGRQCGVLTYSGEYNDNWTVIVI